MANDGVRRSASEVIAAISDDGVCDSWDQAPNPPQDGEYAEQLRRAEQRSGEQESVVTGRLLVHGRPVAAIAGEFAFLAGSAGMAAADRVVAAFRRATAERLPVVGMPVSGGTRMQEGTPAFLRMVAVAAAAAEHRAAGLPYLVWLRDPTTGGVMATWGSLGQITAADPGALVGFLGPRVFEAMTGEPFPSGVQTAENLAAVGVIDAVVSLPELRGWLATVLDVVGEQAASGADDESAGSPNPAPLAPPARTSIPDGWECVAATRRSDRPGSRELIAAAGSDVTWLAGTTSGERDDAVVIALARIGGVPCIVAALDRTAPGAPGPGALRTARRAIALARELGLTMVTVVDTEGAEVSARAEEGALAGEIARSLADLAVADVPVVSVLLGSGCGGGALALLPADVVVAADDAWVTPLPPEGAAAILHRSTERAPQVARDQRITAVELHRLGAVDVLVAGADDDPSDFVGRMAQALSEAVRAAMVSPTRVSKFVVAGP